MKKYGVSAMVVGLSLIWGTTAFAQDPTEEPTGVEYKKETSYDFEGDDVEGALVKPDGESFDGSQHGKTSSLIKIRGDFVPEMLKSVEDI
jgi:hypothetical protein